MRKTLFLGLLPVTLAGCGGGGGHNPVPFWAVVAAIAVVVVVIFIPLIRKKEGDPD